MYTPDAPSCGVRHKDSRYDPVVCECMTDTQRNRFTLARLTRWVPLNSFLRLSCICIASTAFYLFLFLCGVLSICLLFTSPSIQV